MKNAKTELLEHLENKPKVKCAKLLTGYEWDEEDQTLYLLFTTDLCMISSELNNLNL